MTIKIVSGDCREVLATLPDGSVHCVVTSPPYWGLRDYGTAKWDGGDPLCDHKSDQQTRGNIPDTKQATNNRGEGGATWTVCGKCGARRIDSQIGLEPSPDSYVATMVEVFREVRRVLRDDGTLWLNLGDSYASAWVCNRRSEIGLGSMVNGKRENRTNRLVGGLKEKDLVGIPWRVAFALQADGWWLRQDIIWSKPNPMPESVTDRCTKAHEYIFLMSKSARYYYDADAIREPQEEYERGQNDPALKGGTADSGGLQSGRNNTLRPMDQNGAKRVYNPAGRNKRSVWEVATAPFSEAHFATFPPALIEPCILAGCPESGTILDPFGGAGTTGLVADRLGRNAILIELNPEYAAMAERRIKKDAGMFSSVWRDSSEAASSVEQDYEVGENAEKENECSA